jgi:hypothetical protein
MTRDIRQVFLDPERLASIFIWGAGAVVGIAFVTAVVAMAVLK